MTKSGELKHHFQWKTDLKVGYWAPSNLEILQLHGRASGRALPHLLPFPWLSIFIFSTNLAQKSSSSTLRCCASTRTTAVIKKAASYPSPVVCARWGLSKVRPCSVQGFSFSREDYSQTTLGRKGPLNNVLNKILNLNLNTRTNHFWMFLSFRTRKIPLPLVRIITF